MLLNITLSDCCTRAQGGTKHIKINTSLFHIYVSRFPVGKQHIRHRSNEGSADPRTRADLNFNSILLLRPISLFPETIGKLFYVTQLSSLPQAPLLLPRVPQIHSDPIPACVHVAFFRSVFPAEPCLFLLRLSLALSAALSSLGSQTCMGWKW